MLHAANVINTSLGVENGVKEAFIKYAVKGTETGREFGIYMKCLKHMGRITMFGGIAIAGCNAWNYWHKPLLRCIC